MKRFVSLILAVISCLMLCVPAFAVEDIASCSEVNSISASNEVSPQVANPTTAKEFWITKMYVYPAVEKGGKKTYLEDAGVTLYPSSGSGRRVVENTLDKAAQQKMINYAESQGYEVIGWYMEVGFHMYCYLPHMINYRVYSHNQNGGKYWSVGVSRVTYTATIKDYFLFPEDTTSSYTYGFAGTGEMTVYNKNIHASEQYSPTFSAKVTFANT